MAASPTPLERFRDSLDSRSAPTGLTYDMHSLGQLSGEDRLEAEDLLISRIVDREDVRAIVTVGAAGCTRAIEALEKASASARAFVRSAAHGALGRLKGDAASVDRLVKDLEEGDSSTRVDAAFELSRMKAPEATYALLGALDDPDLVVRVHAVEGLLRELELESWAEPRESTLSTLQVGLYTKLAPVYREAGAALRGLFRQVIEGATPESLGLNYQAGSSKAQLARFIDSIGSKAYDVEAVRELGAAEKAWAEAIIVAALDRQDPPAATALAELELTHRIPALQDSLKRDDLEPAFRDAVQAALATLQSPA